MNKTDINQTIFFFLCWNQHKTQKTLGRSFQSSVSWSVPSTATLQHTSRWTSFSLFPSGVFTYKNYEKQLFVTFYFILSQMCSMNACFEELCKSSLLRHTLRNKRIQTCSGASLTGILPAARSCSVHLNMMFHICFYSETLVPEQNVTNICLWLLLPREIKKVAELQTATKWQ